MNTIIIIILFILEILLNPESVVAMTSNDTIHIMCGLGFESDDNFHLVFNGDINSQHVDDKTKTIFDEQGIYWECSKLMCNVSIAAITTNNNFTIQCSIYECCTQIAVINVVDGQLVTNCVIVIVLTNNNIF